MNNEKENTLNKTLKEKENLIKTNENLKKENSILSKKIDELSDINESYQKKLDEIRQELKSEKEKLLNNLKHIEKIKQEKDDLVIGNQQYLQENNSLKILVDQLEIDYQKLSRCCRESEYKFNKELEIKDRELESLKQHFLDIKLKQVEIVNSIEKTTKENIDLKSELQIKLQEIDNLNNYLENLKSELQIKLQEIDKLNNYLEIKNKELENKISDWELIKENNDKLNLQVETVYKPKIKALQSKLKEKVNLLKSSEENI